MKRRPIHASPGFGENASQLLFDGLLNPQPIPPPREWTFPLNETDICKSGDVDASYDMERYRRDIVEIGLRETWNRICRWTLRNGEDVNSFLSVDRFGELYEEGLAIQDKSEKKSSGQYYTPQDVADVMAEWFARLDGDAVCDVACGVGNLVLAYFRKIGREESIGILKRGSLHLYDIDETAILICVTSIAVRYGRECAGRIHAFCCDFLDERVKLPRDCKVISNPPYATVKAIPGRWRKTDVVTSSKELYAAFLEKTLRQSRASVVITPYSFIGGAKFLPLRRIMNERCGFVVSFDNVPGAIFSGRKHGIFNSNMGNSVRAAITVAESAERNRGFRFSPLIRFKSREREKLLTCDKLEAFIGRERQLVTPTKTMFAKCDRRLEHILHAWSDKSNATVKDLVAKDGTWTLNVPSTCRYFTVAVDRPLSRKGQMSIRLSDEDTYWYVMGMVNSSFAYWHWRLYDGGITYPSGLFLRMPVFMDALSQEDLRFCRETGREMMDCAGSFVVRKANVGVQENVKFPRTYRDRLNRRFLDALGMNDDESVFDIIHSNMALEENT